MRRNPEAVKLILAYSYRMVGVKMLILALESPKMVIYSYESLDDCAKNSFRLRTCKPLAKN